MEKESNISFGGAIILHYTWSAQNVLAPPPQHKEGMVGGGGEAKIILHCTKMA